MSRDPRAAAFDASPFWLHRIHLYDALELGRCVRAGMDPSGREILERTHDDDAPIVCWTVYGHLKSGGAEAFEDFATEAAAGAFYDQLRALFPHLRG